MTKKNKPFRQGCFLCIVSLFIINPLLYADTHTIEATLQGAVNAVNSVSLGGSTHNCGVGFLWSTNETRSMIKFDIPVYEDQIIVKAFLNINVTAIYNYPYGPDIQCWYVENDSWDASNLIFNWPTNSNNITVENRTVTNTGEMGLISSDITSWLSLSGEGQGETLSIQLKRLSSSTRGAVIAPVTLTLETVSRGHALLIKNGLQIQAMVYENTGGLDADMWNDSNFTSLNFGWGLNDPSDMVDYLADEDVLWGKWSDALVGTESSYADTLVGLQYGDEQDISDAGILALTATKLSQMKSNYPNAICYTNQLGREHDSSELGTYMASAKPDMLMFDTYPFFDSGPLGGSPTNLYKHMQKYRLLGLAGNDGTSDLPIPYGIYLQAYSDEEGGYTWYAPSESQIRLNQFSAWTFGCKFVTAFFYNRYSSDPNAAEALMFSGVGDSTPTASFDYMADTNQQSLNLGKSLVRLVSTDIRMIMGRHKVSGVEYDNVLPEGVSTWDSSCDPYITSISATNLGTTNYSLRGDVLIGYFTPLMESDDGDSYESEIYFMITNGLSAQNATAQQTQQQITINFDFGSSGITSLLRLNRSTGQVEQVNLVSDGGSQYHLELTLDGGTGDLFKFNTGADFVMNP